MLVSWYMGRQVATIRFRLNVRGETPPYRQLVDQVVNAVKRGRLLPGDRLPSVREVVTQIVINPNTVHRAYRELEHLGVTEARPGLGTFISSDVVGNSGGEHSANRALESWVERAQMSGMSDDEILKMVRKALVDSTKESNVAETAKGGKARLASRPRASARQFLPALARRRPANLN